MVYGEVEHTARVAATDRNLEATKSSSSTELISARWLLPVSGVSGITGLWPA